MFSVALAFRYQECHRILPYSRASTPLTEPDVQLSRIRLFDSSPTTATADSSITRGVDAAAGSGSDIIPSAAKDPSCKQEKPHIRWPDSFGRLRTGSSASPQETRAAYDQPESVSVPPFPRPTFACSRSCGKIGFAFTLDQTLSNPYGSSRMSPCLVSLILYYIPICASIEISAGVWEVAWTSWLASFVASASCRCFMGWKPMPRGTGFSHTL